MKASDSRTARTDVLGVGISVINLEQAVDLVFSALETRHKGYVAVTGVHGVIESQDSSAFREILNGAYLTTPDGMPMVWLGKWNGHKDIGRVYGPDLMLTICNRSVASGHTHYLYGGAEGVAQTLADRLNERFPGIRILGARTPPFRPLNREERRALIEDIGSLRPDLFWVGLGCPKQEEFMAEYLPLLNTTLMLGVGAAFDFHAGLVRQAPRWIQHSGFEWLYRLCMEPRRLWKRYLINNARFIWLIGRQMLGTNKKTGRRL